MKKKIYLSLLYMIGILLLPLGVRATEIVETTPVYEWDSSRIDIKFPELPVINEEDTRYYFYFTDKKEDVPDISSVPHYDDLDAYPGWRIPVGDDRGNNTINIYDSYNILEGYEHVYVAKCKYISPASCDQKLYYGKINKTGIPELTKRYQLYFLSGNLHVLSQFATGTEEIKANTKIGIINDSDIINSLAKGEAGAIEKLLNYGKNASNGTTFSTVLGDVGNNHVLGNYSVKAGSYYYAYTTLDTKNGKYRQVEDITILMGRNDVDGKALLSNDVTYNISDKAYTVSTSVKNPKTADVNVLICVGVAVFVFLVFLISYKKFKSVK